MYLNEILETDYLDHSILRPVSHFDHPICVLKQLNLIQLDHAI